MRFRNLFKKKSLPAEKREDGFALAVHQLINLAFPNVDQADRRALIKAGTGFAYAICNRIANDCAMIPIRLMKKGRSSGLKTIPLDNQTKLFLSSKQRCGIQIKSLDEVQEIGSDPILTRLENMNDYDDGIDVFANTQLHLLQVGTTFWLADRAKPPYIDPQALHLLQPEKMEILVDRGDEATKREASFRKIIGYKYDGNLLSIDEVIRFKYSNAGDWLWGKSPLSAAIEFYNTSGNLATLLKELSKNKNGMDLYLTNRPSNSETQPQILQGDPLKSIKKQFADYRLGNIKVDEIMYLGNLELTAIPNMNKDLPFIENLKGLFKFMCWTFGIPDSIMAQESSNRAVQKESVKDYYASCIQPKLIRLQSRLNSYLLPMFKGAKEQRKFLIFDDCVPPDFDTMLKEIAGGARTPNEYREIRKLDSIDGGELLYMPANMVPVGQDVSEQGKLLALAVKKELERK
jgi:phage portal protein BeeE